MASCWTSNWTTKIVKSIIIPQVNPRRGITFFLDIFLIFWFHFIHLFETGIHINGFRNCDTSQCEKSQIALILQNAFLLIFWYSLLFKRESLKKLFKDYRKFEDSVNNCSLLKLRKILNGTFFAIIFFGTALTIVMLIHFTTDDDLVREYYESFNMFEASFQVQRGIIFVYTASSRIFLKFLPAVIVLLHLSISSTLLLGLRRCEKEMEWYSGEKFIRSFIGMYSTVHNLAMAAEDSFSLTAFFFSCYYFSAIYTIFSDFYYRASSHDGIVWIEKTLTDILQPLLFEAAFLVAAEVHSRDVELRRKLKDKIFKMSLSPSASWYSDYLSRFMESKPVMAFTAFKMFSVTRAFLLTATGVALTYTLLLLQLNYADEKSTRCQ